jgi:two-component system, OmpR family, KDP operon response regulator KdpE
MIELIPTQTSNDLPSDSSHLIVVGQLPINLLIGCVQSNNRSIRLTKLEFNVLVYLARNRGRVVSASELLQEVRSCCPENGGTRAQVKNCIKRLRGKIEPDPKRPCYVLTAYGHGYFMPAYVEAEQTDSIHITGFPEN